VNGAKAISRSSSCQSVHANHIVFADLPPEEQDRLMQFLVVNDVGFRRDAESNGSPLFHASVDAEVGASDRCVLFYGRDEAQSEGETSTRMTGARAGRTRTLAKPQPTPGKPLVMKKFTFYQLVDKIYRARFRSGVALLRHNAETCRSRRAKDLGDVEFRKFVVDFVRKHYGERFLAEASVEAMMRTMHAQRQIDIGAEIFARFFEGEYDTEDLYFFLYAKTLAEKHLDIDVRQFKQVERHHRPLPAPEFKTGWLDDVQCRSVINTMMFGHFADLQTKLLETVAAAKKDGFKSLLTDTTLEQVEALKKSQEAKEIGKRLLQAARSIAVGGFVTGLRLGSNMKENWAKPFWTWLRIHDGHDIGHRNVHKVDLTLVAFERAVAEFVESGFKTVTINFDEEPEELPQKVEVNRFLALLVEECHSYRHSVPHEDVAHESGDAAEFPTEDPITDRP